MAHRELIQLKIYGRQLVVDVVGDAAGELAYRLHLVPLGEL